MKGKAKFTQIYQQDVHLSNFQGQDKDLLDVEVMSISTTLKTWNTFLRAFITLLQ